MRRPIASMNPIRIIVTALFGAIHRSVAASFDGPALFRVAEPSAEPLLIRQAMSAGGVFVEPGERIEASHDESVLRAARDATRFTA